MAGWVLDAVCTEWGGSKSRSKKKPTNQHSGIKALKNQICKKKNSHYVYKLYGHLTHLTAQALKRSASRWPHSDIKTLDVCDNYSNFTPAM